MNEHERNMLHWHRVKQGKAKRTPTEEKQSAAAKANASQNWRRPIIYGRGRR